MQLQILRFLSLSDWIPREDILRSLDNYEVFNIDRALNDMVKAKTLEKRNLGKPRSRYSKYEYKIMNKGSNMLNAYTSSIDKTQPRKINTAIDELRDIRNELNRKDKMYQETIEVLRDKITALKQSNNAYIQQYNECKERLKEYDILVSTMKLYLDLNRMKDLKELI